MLRRYAVCWKSIDRDGATVEKGGDVPRHVLGLRNPTLTSDKHFCRSQFELKLILSCLHLSRLLLSFLSRYLAFFFLLYKYGRPSERCKAQYCPRCACEAHNGFEASTESGLQDDGYVVLSSFHDSSHRSPGLPRMRLPSRNWSIFLAVVGSFSAAVYYDRRQKKLVQKKWCDLVAHVAQDPLSVQQMPRKLTIYLSAAPGDGIRPTRDYFREYIKPILVSAAMDYDVIEGRREGEVRYGTAEQIRRLRRKRGEQGQIPETEEPDVAQAIDMIREKMQVLPEPGLAGDLVIGRHTWKEYIRGLHEGWLGPLDEPPPPPPEPGRASAPVDSPLQSQVTGEATATPLSAASETEETTAEPEKAPEDEKPKKPKTPPAYISTSAYSSSQLSPHIPQVLDPSAPITQRHLLGFLKTPQRIYDFLNRRKLADQIGREVAAIILAANRPYQQDASFAVSSIDVGDGAPVATRAPESDMLEVVQTNEAWEQQAVLSLEEPYWHKSVRKPRKTDDTISQVERVWMNDVDMDPRIAERMRKFEISTEEEERASRIWNGAEKGRAIEVVDLRKEKPKVGALDDD